MKAPHPKRGLCAPAFTLIEIMVVMGIIAVLAGMTLGGMSYYQEKMKFGRTQVLIASIESALEDYKRDNGSYPVGGGVYPGTNEGTTGVLFLALYGDGTNVYLDTLNPDLTGRNKNVEASLIIDAWGNELGYTSPGVMNPANDFDIWSKAASGVDDPDPEVDGNTADDIKNW